MKSFIVFLIFCPVLLLSQQNELITMREQAIIEYGKDLQSFLQEQEELLKTEDTKQKRDYIDDLKHKMSNFYIMDENENPIEIHNSSTNLVQFKPIGLKDKKYQQILKKEIHFIKVFTRMESNRFIVTLVEFGSKYKNGRLSFLTSMGSAVEKQFKYSCEDGNWKLLQ